MKQALKILAVAVVGTLLGFATAFWGVPVLTKSSTVQNGAWRTNADIGSKDADPWTRTAVAITGLLALNKAETIYFGAGEDDAGNPLRANCVYKVEGGAIASRWWSITVYGADSYLIPNARERYSYNIENVSRDARGSYRIFVGGRERPGNWLPTGEGNGAITLTLRLYNPAREVYERLDEVALPSITQESCS